VTYGNIWVQCEHDHGIYGGNWTLVAKREVGDQDFYMEWDDYKDGFGDVLKDYFIGLSKIHTITCTTINELLIYLQRRTGEVAYAHYSAFSIGNEHEKFTLKLLGNYSGTAGDALRYHIGQKFTTRDQDNDKHPTQNCARLHAGAWWYKDCMERFVCASLSND